MFCCCCCRVLPDLMGCTLQTGVAHILLLLLLPLLLLLLLLQGTA
jgi:hypothetical protein